LRDVAIVGGGLVGFIARATLRRGAIEDVTVFDADGADPAAAWRRRAESIRQRRMRSESDGHCLPASFPGLAVRSAFRRGTPWPLVQSLCDRYHPTVSEFLDHVEEQRAKTGWDEAVVERRIRSVRAVEGGFELDGELRFRHVLLATGHPGLNLPEELAGRPGVVHAYAPHEYAGDVTVVGGGMAAATEWLNALAAGARVTSVRRREPGRLPLSVARSLFSRRGLAAYQATTPAARLAALASLLAPSYPAGRRWDEPLARAGARFRVAPEVNGSEQVICATGFTEGFRNDAVLRRLVDDHALETHGRWIALAADCTVPALTSDDRTLGIAGVGAQWAYPAADTLLGAKYAARGFLRRVRACRTP
jgi:cation diffusion facilitator CzcD-associated flavoprotein CzcO